ncbi:MAG: pyruvate dehydrogenase (acetyl-transferring) E1 component subunit alpha [Chlamydiia bacterium]|nr:pyruvate dehydrogenase (acetyl-transferring) E1 component subunit alpha [Chlamydiia bacterium]
MQEELYHFFPNDRAKEIAFLGATCLLEVLRKMLLIRNFEQRGEAAYGQGKVGGFYHSYAGQEAIQTACIEACGVRHWFTTTYRCHALALLLGATPNAMMAELYGKSTGLAMGRGGSMHMYADRLLGGLAIVGGHVPIATGAAFSIKYLKQKELVSFCFLGEGATVQGAFHESLNLATLWNLPCIYVIENNQWGMGTAAQRAVCVKPIGEHFAKSYGIRSYTLNGLDFFNCYTGFKDALHHCLADSKPILIEVVAERLRGHSISDPGLYRSKEELKELIEKDPLVQFKNILIQQGILTEGAYQELDKQQREIAIAAMQFAEESPLPAPIVLEEGVFAPREGL